MDNHGDQPIWRIVQHFDNLDRYEPRNVGVMLRTPDGWISKFIAVDDDGRVDARRLRKWKLTGDAYEAWVRYFRRKMAEDALADIDRAQAHRRGSFVADHGGELVAAEVASWPAELERLYKSLVSEDQSTGASVSQSDELKDRVQELFAQIDLQPETEISVSGLFGKHREMVDFDYRYVNGQPHLMQALPLGGPRGLEKALAFNARALAATKAGSARSFLAFYDGARVDTDLDRLLHPVEAVSATIDVAIEDEALTTLEEILTSH